MRRQLGLLGCVLLLTACRAMAPAPPPQGARLIPRGSAIPVYVTCDKGNSLYTTENGGVAVIQGGCFDGPP